ncbi:hypothetical protein ANTQUA_LOCUS3318 [Anthophora quadrimaculata]
MRLAAHLCGDRPYRHHRTRTKLVNLLTARTLLFMGVSSSSWGTMYSSSGGYVFGSMVAHMEAAERICCDNAANDLPSAFVMLNCGSILTP